MTVQVLVSQSNDGSGTRTKVELVEHFHDGDGYRADPVLDRTVTILAAGQSVLCALRRTPDRVTVLHVSPAAPVELPPEKIPENTG